MQRSLLHVRVTPRAGRDAVTRFEDGVLHVRVAAPPADGAANKALLEVVAGALAVPRSKVRIRSGASSRQKTLEIDGLDGNEVAARLCALAPPS
jgi:uncharacterized protein (TIGR00251 family)